MRLILLAATLDLVWSPAWAENLVQYGNRAGQEAHVVSRAGLSTAHARLRARITRSDAVEFCRDSVHEVSQRCISQTLAGPSLKSVTADCPAGTFTDFDGDHWRFAGLLGNPESMVKYRLFHVGTREVADGSMVSNYGISLDIFRALCPKQAPPESAGY